MPAPGPIPIRLRISGERACFTRPEMKVERVSYDAMTPSAARGILEAILWKPQMRWTVTRIDVLKPIRWDSVRRNEVGRKAPADAVLRAMSGGAAMPALVVEDERQQRASLLLRDVAYVVHALIESCDPDEPTVKFAEMFSRRARAGQCFAQPYLGCREFAADFALVEDADPGPQPIAEDRDLGWMLQDFDYVPAGPRPRFFRATMKQGRISIPASGSAELVS